MIPVSRLTRRLAETPTDFLSDHTSPAAIVSDLLYDLGKGGLDAATAAKFGGRETTRDTKWLRLVQISSWLVADPAFKDAIDAKRLLDFYFQVLPQLAALIEPGLFVTDPDRREELARLAMLSLSVMPEGETAEQAADRLTTVDSVRRYQVFEETKVAEKRAAAVRKAMEAERAREAAARYSQV